MTDCSNDKACEIDALRVGQSAMLGIVLGQAIYRIVFPRLPVYAAIGVIGLLALAANCMCFYLLWRHRAEDINMSLA